MAAFRAEPLIEMLNRLAPGFVFLFILGLFSNVQAEAKADYCPNMSHVRL